MSDRDSLVFISKVRDKITVTPHLSVPRSRLILGAQQSPRSSVPVSLAAKPDSSYARCLIPPE